jgi:hypothetical protein
VASYKDIADAFAGHPVGNLTRDQVLDDVTFYWLTNTAISSARLYWENTVGFFDVKNVSIPAAVTVFPHEIYQAPRSWAKKAYPKLMYFNEVDRGRALRRLAGAGPVLRRAPRRLPVAPLALWSHRWRDGGSASIPPRDRG